MADFVTHHLFGEQTLTVFPVPAQLAAARRPVCFRWGLQGPDPLFYRKIALGSPLHALGNQMHSEKTDHLFFAMARAVNRLTGDEREMAEAYFYGFLCHYALDSQIHPYVYCRQEEARTGSRAPNASSVHCQIESDIDYALYEQVYSAPVTDFDPDEYYRLADDELAVLAVLLQYVLSAVYGRRVETAELRGAFREMLAWENFLYSESTAVYHGARRVETLLGRGALLTSHMKLLPPDWDCLNEAHTPWHNLWSPEAVRTDSVFDLLALARITAAALAGQYAAQFDAGWLLLHRFDLPFDNGSPKKRA